MYTRGKRRHTPAGKASQGGAVGDASSAGVPSTTAAPFVDKATIPPLPPAPAAETSPEEETKGWSYDPGSLMQQHGRKGIYVLFLLYLIFFTDMPLKKIMTWGVILVVGMLGLLLVKQDSMLYHPVVGTSCEHHGECSVVGAA